MSFAILRAEVSVHGHREPIEYKLLAKISSACTYGNIPREYISPITNIKFHFGFPLSTESTKSFLSLFISK